MKKFPTQKEALAKMELQTRRVVMKFEKERVKPIRELWHLTKRGLKAAVLGEYAQDFGAVAWTLPEARRRGTLIRLERQVKAALASFRAAAVQNMQRTFNDLERMETARALWILDQSTPASVAIAKPLLRMREAARDLPWGERMGFWLDGYGDSLVNHVSQHALNSSDPFNAAMEVDATKVYIPTAGRFDPETLIERLFVTEMTKVSAMARDAVARTNESIVEREIWQTVEDDAVCEFCEAQDGLDRNEAEGYIPAHPHCHCFYRIVPVSWAALLRSGNANDKRLALMMDDAGLVDDSMVIEDNGRLMGSFVASFDTWAVQNVAELISGGIK